MTDIKARGIAFPTVTYTAQDMHDAAENLRTAGWASEADVLLAVVAELTRLDAEVARLREALFAAETMLMVAPQISTNARGTRPNMTTKAALILARAALTGGEDAD